MANATNGDNEVAQIPNIYFYQRDVLDRGDDLVLVNNVTQPHDSDTRFPTIHSSAETDAANISRDPSFHYPELHGPSVDNFCLSCVQGTNGSVVVGTTRSQYERTIIRRGTGSYINQLVIESDCEPEEATFDDIKAWLNRDRKIIYTPAPEEQLRAITGDLGTDIPSHNLIYLPGE